MSDVEKGQPEEEEFITSCRWMTLDDWRNGRNELEQRKRVGVRRSFERAWGWALSLSLSLEFRASLGSHSKILV